MSVFYSQYHAALSQINDIENWLPWLVADALDRTETDAGEHRPGADVLAEATVRLRYDRNYFRGLDSSLGGDVLGAVAPLAVDDPDTFEQLVTEGATRLRSETPADWLVNDFGAEPSPDAAAEFVSHVYARAMPDVSRPDEERLDRFHDRAVEAARATTDPSTALTVFYSRSLPWFSAHEFPNEEPESHRWLFDTALTTEEVHPGAFYSAYLTELHRSGAHDDDWFVALAVDAIDRLRSGEGFSTDTERRVETATGVVAEALQLFEQAKGMSGEVPDSVVAATETVEAESPDLFDPFVEGVAERLEAEHDALLLALEWRTAFGIE